MCTYGTTGAKLRGLTMFEASSQASLRKIGREICWYIDEKPDLNTIYDKDQFDNTR